MLEFIRLVFPWILFRRRILIDTIRMNPVTDNVFIFNFSKDVFGYYSTLEDESGVELINELFDFEHTIFIEEL